MRLNTHTLLAVLLLFFGVLLLFFVGLQLFLFTLPPGPPRKRETEGLFKED